MAELLSQFPRPGRIEAILLRPSRRADPQPIDGAELALSGLVGDHARPGKRALTLIQAEHIPVISSLAGREATAELLRRNVVVSGINLGALRGARLRIGLIAEVEITSACAPCSRMEEALGRGGYNAVRGHGGWCATVLRAGPLHIGDSVLVLPST
ncbi:MAG: MOSC domain protein [uncultured Rubellimicrobium sp.]|uniref:MOSC domain protein n=1 Tax=uncultured Rubellimicrobium sp. TaxID=543078 RepID=A0A6J4PNT5_9RHOB|nr:MAG: MOSC domain protein [uncultured Rubellimicrobium sp.]